ncbi:hypothetical protein NK6_8789 [Bradyrhizobium diazoefficiens]|uniref:Uncharacterized protein n=1 Tax=Bradyrhizobium diazoefficiens TaxID=1355477 RepID=A0A0E4BWK6_9BRAD|nr:hypothetical protein NK6_8789 [Bradyrhizobium diazoefficiens]
MRGIAPNRVALESELFQEGAERGLIGLNGSVRLERFARFHPFQLLSSQHKAKGHGCVIAGGVDVPDALNSGVKGNLPQRLRVVCGRVGHGL